MVRRESADVFASKLVAWYKENARDLPWRQTQDPYRIWLSEIILQQTRVVQGLPYYLKFTGKFPTVGDLAKATEEEVLRTWQGLGYYSRARNLLKCARQVNDQYRGKFPTDYKQLLSLPGIGPYTAAAVSSFAFGGHHAVVDGNVYRVLSRYFGIGEDIGTESGIDVFRKLAQYLLPQQDSATYNQAIMEFGAVQCKPGIPDCSVCPLQETCIARRESRIGDLPLKSRKTKVKSVYLHYTFLIWREKIFLRQRTSGFWRGLYEPWLTELESEPINGYLLNNIPGTGDDGITIEVEKPYIHVLSHRILHCWFLVVEIDDMTARKLGESYFKNIEEVDKLPKPILIEKFLSDSKFQTLSFFVKFGSNQNQ